LAAAKTTFVAGDAHSRPMLDIPESPCDHKTLNTQPHAAHNSLHLRCILQFFDLAFSHKCGPDFGARLVQVGTNGKSYQREGTNNTDFNADRRDLRLVYALLRNPVFFIAGTE
jgi:hypothetical protein